MGTRTVPFPPERRLVLDTLRLGRRRAMMHGLLEIDVTRARSLLRERRARTGEATSFTAFVLACLGRAAAAHPEVHALRSWSGRLAQFDVVDVTTIVEIEVEGRPFGLAHVVRGTERRTAGEIGAELRAVKGGGLRSVAGSTRRATRLLLLVPGFLRRLLWRALLGFPRLMQRRAGSVLLTAVGMFGGGAGFGLGAPGIHGLTLLVGGIARRPAADGRVHELLCLTVSADHELVDGAPLARFARDLRERLERAEGLEAG